MSDVRAEADDVRTTWLFLAVVVGVVVLGAVVLGVQQYFDLALRDELQRKVLAVESTALRNLRAAEQVKLGSYQWVDRKAGVVRIPVDRAMELTLAEWAARPTGFVPKAPQPPAAAQAQPPPAPAQALSPAP